MAHKRDLILSLDFGTSAIKTGLFSIAGELVALASRDHSLSFPRPDRTEQSPAEMWRLASDASRQVLEGTATGQVAAVVSTHHRGSVVPLGKDGEPLTDLIVWMDRRGLPQVDRLRRLIGDAAYYAISGHPIVPVTGVSKLLWLQSEAPDIWGQTRMVVPPQTLFLRWLGCDEDVVDYSSGSYHFPCDIRQRRWSEEIARELSFPAEKLPRLAPATAIVGQLRPSAARDLGLPSGIPIIAGGGDGQCAAAGAGVVAPGRVMVNIGTATSVQVFLPRPAFDSNQTLNCAAHVVPDAWEMEGHTQASGVALRWFRDEFRGEAHDLSSTDAYEALIGEAATIPAGSEGLTFLPMFNGSTAPVIAADATGALVGLRLSHTRSHVVRALLEGISLEIRWMVDTIADTGAAIDEMRLVGGGSRNATWNQMHADVLGRPAQTVQQPNAALVGAAICAAVGLGAFPDFQAASDAFVKLGATIIPDASNSAIYEESLSRYVGLFRRLNQTGR